ncbi:hypothetical protein ACQ4WX_35805 [Streptomyces lasalocidi]
MLLADEPVSALDVSVRAQILDLLRTATAERDMALCVISHDLGVIRYLCDTVLVLRDGKVVESGSVESVWNAPSHPYTEQLLAAVPRMTTARHRRQRSAPCPLTPPPALCSTVFG